MTTYQLKVALREALDNVNKELSNNGVGFYGRGLSSEGFAGGYRQALFDVQQALNNVPPQSRFWPKRSVDNK